MKKLLTNILRRLHIYYPALIAFHGVKNKVKSYQYRLQSKAVKTGGYRCNFCEAQYQQFVTYAIPQKYKAALLNNQVIAGYGNNCICPKCLSTSRERLVKIYLENLLKPEGKKVLHFAPEKKIHGLLKTAHVTSVDIDSLLYKHVDSAIQFADATKLPFKNETFDCVIANHILEHIPDDAKAMSEMYRVMKKGGKALLQVPYSKTIITTIEQLNINNPVLQAQVFGQEDHVRIYALQDYCNRLKCAGFLVNVIADEYLKQFEQSALQPEEVIIEAYK